MKTLAFALLIITGFAPGAFAQFTSALIGVDGLTCSACSFGTEKSLRKLPFVNQVIMDLNQNTALLTFHEGQKVDVDALVKKVYDAGFSVRFVKADFNFKSTPVKKEGFFIYNNDYYCFLTPPPASVPELATLLFIDDKYLPKKESRQYKEAINNKEKLKPGPGGKVYLIKYE